MLANPETSSPLHSPGQRSLSSTISTPGRTAPSPTPLSTKHEKAADQARRSCGLLAAQPLILDQTKGARDTVERLIADHLNGTKEFNELIVDYPNVANWHLI